MLSITSLLTALVVGGSAVSTLAPPFGCAGLPTHAQLQAALMAARAADDGRFNHEMWGTVVNRSGQACALSFTGTDFGARWPGSRVIPAQRANTANAFRIPSLALSTANLYSAVRLGGSLFGVQVSNSVFVNVACKGLIVGAIGVSDDTPATITSCAVAVTGVGRSRSPCTTPMAAGRGSSTPSPTA